MTKRYTNNKTTILLTSSVSLKISCAGVDGDNLMKRYISILTMFFLLILTLLNVSYASDTFFQPKTIFVAGDSTAATYNKSDHQGWAGVFQSFFDDKQVKVDNRARGGRSTRTFIAEGLWEKLINDVQAGDIVFIQFGHNDSSPINDDRRARGTIPGIGDESVDIHNLLTDKDETIYSFGHYIRKMVSDVNLTNPVADQLEALGQEKTAQMYTKDYVHFNPLGAELHASTIVAALKGLKPTIAPTFYSDKGKSVKSDDWTWLRLPIVHDANLPSVFMVGDSTVRNGAGDGTNGQWGWGSFLGEHIDTKKVNLVNRAIGGFSSRTFITGGHWQRALNMMKPGDYVLINW